MCICNESREDGGQQILNTKSLVDLVVGVIFAILEALKVNLIYAWCDQRKWTAAESLAVRLVLGPP